MRKIIQEKNYLVFRDLDGVLSFSIRAYEDCPLNPRFLFDGDKQVFLLRRPGQVILLDGLTDEFVTSLARTSRIRFLETPEDSSEIIRQYEITVTKIENVPLDPVQMVNADEDLSDYLPHSA